MWVEESTRYRVKRKEMFPLPDEIEEDILIAAANPQGNNEDNVGDEAFSGEKDVTLFGCEVVCRGFHFVMNIN